MRVRPDLTAERQRYQGRVYMVVKDPLGLNYFRFQEEEFAILNMLDGEVSLDEIKERFEAEFPPQKITVEEVQRFLGMLHQSGLIIADTVGQGHQLRLRRDKKKRKELLGKFTNVLAIRFKGVDPERLLNFLSPLVKPLFHPLGVFLALTLMLSALTLVIVQFGEFQSRLPTFHQFFGSENWLLLGVVLMATKVIHEFGHGLTCKYFGGECHEIGVLILVLTPCLYCNVSDSWMLPSKWRRAMIGAAGMYIELLLASICTFIWWFSEPTTTLNQICLSTMFVSSVSTILFNANPLLRYDGYYILADLVEIPNLRQKSTKILGRKLAHWCLGIEPQEDPFLPKRNHIFFALYTVAASIYRWVIVFGILFFLNKVFEPYGLKIIGQAIALMAIYGMVVMPLWKIGKFFYIPGRIEKVKKHRMYATIGVITLVILGIVYIPLPYYVMCSMDIQTRDAEKVYAELSGSIVEVKVQPGQWVNQGDVILVMKSVDAQLAVERLEGEWKQYVVRCEVLERQSITDPDAQKMLGPAQALRDATKIQLEQTRAKLDHLTLRAPIDGYVLPAREMPDRPNASGTLSRWSGSPFDKKNLNAMLQEQQRQFEICRIGYPDRLKAVIIVDQTDRGFITKGQRVDIMLDTGLLISGEISDVSPQPLRDIPPALTNKSGGELPTETDDEGVERPISTSYAANVPLGDEVGKLSLSATGKARVRAGYRSLGSRAWRYLSTTFNFRL